MIPFPTLPTDSLYKFLFVGGLILVLASNYLSDKAFEESSAVFEKIDSIQLRSVRFKQTIVNNQIFIDSISKEIDEYHNLSSSEQKALISKASALNGKFDSYNSRLDSLETDNKKVDRYLTRINNLDKKYLIFTCLGFFMLLFGNIGWFKQQWLNDKMTKTQANILELEYQRLLKGEKVDYSKYRKP